MQQSQSSAAERVLLRPTAEADLDWLASFHADRDSVGEHNWSGRDDLDVAREKLKSDLESGDFASDSKGRLVVCFDSGEPIGHFGWRTQQWGPTDASRCLAIGIALLPQHRGHGYGTIAQRLLVDHLFNTTSTHRVEADTAVDNPAEQRSLEKAGFTREGVVRSAEWRDGQYHDHVLFSVLRTEWS